MNKFKKYLPGICVACLCGGNVSAQSDSMRIVADFDFETVQQEVSRVVEQIPDLVEQRQAIVEAFTPTTLTFQHEKVIEKAYPVNRKHQLSIDNRYGRISVHNWNRNEAKVTITVRTAEGSEKRAQEALDRVRIEESTEGNVISLKTDITASGGSWWSSLTGESGDRALNIDYEVYLPKQNELTLANQYGPVELDDRDGKVTLSVKYGSLQVNRLNADDNTLSLAYSKATIDYIRSGEVAVRYGGFTLEEGDKITLATSYSSDSKIGRISETADVTVRYGAPLHIGLGSSIKRVNVDASYAKIVVEPAENAAFSFNATVHYGGFDYDGQHINITSKSDRMTSKSYTGYWNNKATENTVTIRSRYGAVSLR